MVRYHRSAAQTPPIRFSIKLLGVDKLVQDIGSSGQTLGQSFEQAYGMGKSDLESLLSTEPPPVTRNVKNEWVSAKQRYAANQGVYNEEGEYGQNWGRGRPYVRTHKASQSWDVLLARNRYGATLTIRNTYEEPNPFAAENFSALYLYGGLTPETALLQQPMHKITGWFNAYDLLVEEVQLDIERVNEAAAARTVSGQILAAATTIFLQSFGGKR